VEPVHRGAGGDDPRRRGVAHLVGGVGGRVDVVDGVLGEPAIGAEAVGAVPLLAIPVVQARGVHAFAAALAPTTAGMYLDRHPVADIELVDGRPELHHGAHIFVTRGEALMERQVAVDHRRYAVPDNLDVSGA